MNSRKFPSFISPGDSGNIKEKSIKKQSQTQFIKFTFNLQLGKTNTNLNT